MHAKGFARERGHQEVVNGRPCPGNHGMKLVKYLRSKLKFKVPQKKINMKKYLMLSVTVIMLLIILITPKGFHNDITSLIDKILLFSIAINCFFILYYKKIKKKFLYVTFFQFLCIFTTVTFNDEIDYSQMRIINLFFKGYNLNETLLIIFENVWFVSLILTIVFQLRVFYLLYKTSR